MRFFEFAEPLINDIIVSGIRDNRLTFEPDLTLDSALNLDIRGN